MMKKKKEKYEWLFKLTRCIYKLERRFYRYPKESIIPKFERALKKLGYRPFKHMELQYFCWQYPKKTQQLVLDFYHKAKLENEKDFCLYCLFVQENKNLIPFFLEEYYRYTESYIEQQYLCELIQNCIYVSKNIRLKEEYLKIIDDSSVDSDIWPFLYIFGELQIEEAIPYLKELVWRNTWVHDEAFIALTKYKNQNKLKTFLKKHTKKVSFFPKEITNGLVEERDKKTCFAAPDSNISAFLEELNKIGLRKNRSYLETIDFCQKHPEETKTIILKYYESSTLLSDKRFYMKCLTAKDNDDLYPFLLQELRKWHRIKIDTENHWEHLNNLLFVTRDMKYKEEYLKILNDNRYMGCNFLIIALCGKLQLKEVIPYLLDILKDEFHPQRDDALESLGYYKNKKEYKDVFKRYENHPNTYTRNLAKKILKKIKD